jgi:hypothetical protein
MRSCCHGVRLRARGYGEAESGMEYLRSTGICDGPLLSAGGCVRFWADRVGLESQLSSYSNPMTASNHCGQRSKRR